MNQTQIYVNAESKGLHCYTRERKKRKKEENIDNGTKKKVSAQRSLK